MYYLRDSDNVDELCESSVDQWMDDTRPRHPKFKIITFGEHMSLTQSDLACNTRSHPFPHVNSSTCSTQET